MNREKKISIIVPVYNAEKYLKRCIESIIKQNYKNLELILIDDGSTDRSGAICDEYSNIDNRIKVLHIENSGPATARNKGISIISGSYLTFVDADDEVEKNTYLKLVEELEKNSVDMIVSSWKVINNNNVSEVYIGDEIIEAKDMIGLIAINDEKYGGGYPWNRIINIEKIKDKLPIFDKSLYVYEDKVWVIELLKYIDKVKLTNTISYKYYVYDFSLSHSSENMYMKMENKLIALEKILYSLRSIDSKYINYFYKIYCENIINFSFKSIIQRKKIKKDLVESNKDSIKGNLKNYSLKLKIKYCLISILYR